MQSSINNALKDLSLKMEPTANHPPLLNIKNGKSTKAIPKTEKQGDVLQHRLLLSL